MGIPVFTETEHLSFMIQQQQSAFPAFRLETGWSLEGFGSRPWQVQALRPLASHRTTRDGCLSRGYPLTELLFDKLVVLLF
jgi:hypothetical protein